MVPSENWDSPDQSLNSFQWHESCDEQSAEDAEPKPAASAAAPNPGAGIDYGLFLDCVHCGLCTAACPTYVETGNENDSPRGRIYLMRSVTDGRLELTHDVRRHLELCLDCRACETACPSGVQYGKLIEPFRVAMEQTGGERKSADWFHRWILFRLFPYPRRMRAAIAPARWAQFFKLDRMAEALGLFRLLPPRLRQLVRMLPPLGRSEPALPAFLPAIGPRRARVALFTGCVGDAMFRPTNWATARVLAAKRLRRGGAAIAGLLRGDSFSRRLQRPGPRSLPTPTWRRSTWTPSTR